MLNGIEARPVVEAISAQLSSVHLSVKIQTCQSFGDLPSLTYNQYMLDASLDSCMSSGVSSSKKPLQASLVSSSSHILARSETTSLNL